MVKNVYEIEYQINGTKHITSLTALDAPEALKALDQKHPNQKVSVFILRWLGEQSNPCVNPDRMPCLEPEKMNGYCDQWGGSDFEVPYDHL